jgi:hypothetical protein
VAFFALYSWGRLNVIDVIVRNLGVEKSELEIDLEVLQILRGNDSEEDS